MSFMLPDHVEWDQEKYPETVKEMRSGIEVDLLAEEIFAFNCTNFTPAWAFKKAEEFFAERDERRNRK